jgi:hypothetical protein
MPTFEPQEFSLRPIQDRIKYDIRMSNLKQGRNNVQVEVVRATLVLKYPAFVPPGSEYDFHMTQGVLRFQDELGHEQTGIITKEEAVELSQGQEWSIVA